MSDDRDIPPAASPRLTHRRVLNIAVPIVLANATVPLLGLVDTGVIGQLGEAAPIGAVGIGAIILTSIYWIFGFLRMGTSGLVAQSHGAGDQAQVGAHLFRALTIGGFVGLALIALHGPIFWAAFRLAPASAEVEALARDYLEIRIWGAPATIALYALTGWLIAVERTRAVLVLQVLQNGLNVLLSVWFVLWLQLGVPGLAWSTLMAEYSGLLLGLAFAWPTLRAALAGTRSLRVLFARDRMARLARVNGDIMIRSILVQGSFTAFLFLAAGQGDVTLAANQVLLQFLTFTAYALDGFAFAAESLVGQAVGARRPDRLRRSALLASQWGVGGAMLLGLVFWLFGGVMIDLLTTSPEVRAEARNYLVWMGAAPLVAVAGWMLDGIFIGATMTREMRVAMLQSVVIYVVAVITLLPLWGNHGLWAALMILNVARGLSMARFYPRAEIVAGAKR